MLQQAGLAAGIGLGLFLACAWLIGRRMRRRGTGFFFWLEFVYLPVLIVAGAAATYLHVGGEAVAEATVGTLVVLWLLSFLVIGVWALFLPFAWYFTLPLALFGGVVLAGVTLGNLAGIAFELWRRRRKNGG